ncbi:unnamed protein product [Diabrotica balteata]|uniref:Reverse transcriptase domain-containing protein n=1 Tax=Diabrotica balteata TaxID=107213 RepID=A0A9N9SRC4_DIABA|nr:unnamed protein product [Diabrotica balteata]
MHKATGPDEINIEAIKLLDEENIEILVRLFNRIYDTGYIPREWLQSSFVMIPKTANATKCSEHRLISLMSHLLKLFLRILHSRTYKILEELSGSTQFGFKGGLGTRKAILCLNTFMQNCLDQRKDVYLTFIDYEKAIDNVTYDIMMELLHRANIDQKEIRNI